MGVIVDEAVDTAGCFTGIVTGTIGAVFAWELSKSIYPAIYPIAEGIVRILKDESFYQYMQQNPDNIRYGLRGLTSLLGFGVGFRFGNGLVHAMTGR